MHFSCSLISENLRNFVEFFHHDSINENRQKIRTNPQKVSYFFWYSIPSPLQDPLSPGGTSTLKSRGGGLDPKICL